MKIETVDPYELYVAGTLPTKKTTKPRKPVPPKMLKKKPGRKPKDSLPFESAAPVGVEIISKLSQIEALETQLRQLREQVTGGDPVEEPQATSSPEKIFGGSVLMHFVEDGFTAFGQVWYRGQELDIPVDDPRAQGWLSAVSDDAEQMRRWGRVYFRPGPWPGAAWSDELDEKEKARNRKVPPVRH